MKTISKLYRLLIGIFTCLTKCHLDSIIGIKGFLYYAISSIANKVYLYSNKSIKVSGNIDYEVIVSMTSYGERANKVYIAIDSLLSQSVRPYKIILWLSEDEFNNQTLPNELKERMQKFDYFEVGYCEDLKPHKKYYESMIQYANKCIVTADDDVFYPIDWLETLINLHNEYPRMICCTNAHKIVLENNKILKYDCWENLTNETGPSLLLCPVGIGGVLYPPKSLDDNVFDKNAIKQCCLNADDLWLRVMGIIKGTSVVKTNKFPYSFLCVSGSQKTALSKSNVIQNKNDEQLNEILTIYGENISKVLVR